jgi:peptidoglycan/xylan/chitin deacetylase (PgdA/CDA1 family)
VVAAAIAVLATVVAIAAVASCGSSGAHHAATTATPSPTVPAKHASTTPPRSVPTQPIPPARPGIAHVIFRGPPRGEVALTIDDGFCPACAARIIHTLASTGAHATIFPNGRYSTSWDPLAPEIKRLVAAGQLTVGNHTFLHDDPLGESSDAFRTDLARNERWIERTFGITARPFFRPPYGAYNSETVAVAGELGYTKVIMWSGTVADSSPRTEGYIRGAIRYWAHPGSIILMHANYPATSLVLPQLLAILHQRGLRPVTLQELLG